MRWLAIVLVFLYCGCAEIATSPLQGQRRDVVDKTGEIKEPSFERLDSALVGILVKNPEIQMQTEGRQGPPRTWAFASGDESLRWIYVQAKDDPEAEAAFVQQGDISGTRTKFDRVRLLDDTVAKRLGFAGPFELVKVQVNDGKGSAPSDRFVATEILPAGTDVFSSSIEASLERAQADFERAKEERQTEIDVLLELARREAIGDKPPTQTPVATIRPAVTWDPKDHHLRITLFESIAGGLYQYATGASSPVDAVGQRFGTEYGVEWSAEYRFDKNGELVSAGISEPEPFKRTLEPPR